MADRVVILASSPKPDVYFNVIGHNARQGVRKFVLSNGLRVLVFRRSIAPVFAGQTWVRVGGVDETLGKTGAAHLLEHMAFKGTETVGTKDFAKEKVLLEKVEVLMDRLEPNDLRPNAAIDAARASDVKDLKRQLEEGSPPSRRARLSHSTDRRFPCRR